MAQTQSKTKPKATQVAEIKFSLPQPHRIDGSVDAMIEQTIAEKYKSILLVPTSEKDVTKGKVVLSHTPSEKDPNIQVTRWGEGFGHVTRFIQGVVNALSSGFGLSGDGSCVWVEKHHKTVTTAVPNILNYDLYLVPNGRAGASKYRVSVRDAISMVLKRAEVIDASVKVFGIAQGKERTKKSEDAPKVTAIL